MSQQSVGRIMLLMVLPAWVVVVLFQLSGVAKSVDPIPAAGHLDATLVAGVLMMWMVLGCLVGAFGTCAMAANREWRNTVRASIVFAISVSPVLVLRNLSWAGPMTPFEVLAGLWAVLAWIGIGVGLMKGPEKSAEQAREEAYEEYEKYR